MKKRVISCIVAAVMLISAAGCNNSSVSVKLNGKDVYSTAQNGASSQQKLIENALGPEVWKDHLENDLMKFWTKPDAQDMSDGLFNTYLSNSGEKLSADSSELPEEIKAAMEDDVMKDLMDIGTNYVRAHSRLTYAYGVAYHMTGNSEYLEMCRKGTLALQEAFDGEYGMHVTKDKETGEWDADRNARTSQDLAYGITGMGMYYFLTHDEDVMNI